MSNIKYQIPNKTKSLISNLKFEVGFTLVEALVSLTIIGLVGFILSDLLLRTFRGNDKTALIGSIKQNGQSAMNIMQQTIRTSESIACVDTTEKRILTVAKGGRFTRFIFTAEVSGVSNGYIVQDNPTLSDPNNPNLLCNTIDTPIVTANKIELTNLDTQTGVSLKYVDGTKSKFERVSGNTILIDFFLGPPVKAVAAYQNQIGADNSIEFQTTVQVR